MNQQLINKYRPLQFDEVFGHEEILTALKRAIKPNTRPHCFLLTGPGGLGKTTLARIIGHNLHAELLEIDAASNSGVDAMRELVELGNHMSLSGEGRRMVIIDECHTLSKNAWQALLKITEEPPDHLFFSLCTTEPSKVPVTIQTRSYKVALRPLSPADVISLLEEIAEAEQWTVVPEVLAAVVEAAKGSPRMGISILQAVHGCQDRDEVKHLVQLIGDSDPVMQLARHLAKGGSSWVQIQPLLEAMTDAEIEAAVPQLGGYMCSAMQGAKTEKEARKFWEFINALAFPTDSYDTRVKFYAIIGRILWSD